MLCSSSKKDADPEKKKYFRVQANHVAPVGSQYSREAVKRRKLDNEVYLHGILCITVNEAISSSLVPKFSNDSDKLPLSDVCDGNACRDQGAWTTHSLG